MMLYILTNRSLDLLVNIYVLDVLVRSHAPYDYGLDYSVSFVFSLCIKKEALWYSIRLRAKNQRLKKYKLGYLGYH